MARKFVLGFSVLLFMISGFITFLAVQGPVPENLPVENLEVHAEQQEKMRNSIGEEVHSGVVPKKVLPQNRVNGLEEKFDDVKGELQDARNRLEALKQFQTTVDAELTKHAEEGQRYQSQINNIQKRIATLEKELVLARRAPVETEQKNQDFPDDLKLPRVSIDGSSKEIVITLGDGLFTSGRDAISLKMKDILEQKAEQIKAIPGYRISVEGHTDNIPLSPGVSKKYSSNMELSYLRAMSVAARFLELGVDPKRITVKGYGETRPLASNETPAGRARNRRVEIRLIKQ
jgi:chemotaxis protein MotB